MSAVAHAGDDEDLLKAAFAGDLPQVRTLVEKGANIDFQSKTLPTALIIASAQGHEGVVEALLTKGAKINLQSQHGVTALIIASQEGNEEVVKALLPNGAVIDMQDEYGGRDSLEACKDAANQATAESSRRNAIVNS